MLHRMRELEAREPSMEPKTPLSLDPLDDSRSASPVAIPVGMIEAILCAVSAITTPHAQRRFRRCAGMSSTASIGDLDDLAFARLLADACWASLWMGTCEVADDT